MTDFNGRALLLRDISLILEGRHQPMASSAWENITMGLGQLEYGDLKALRDRLVMHIDSLVLEPWVQERFAQEPDLADIYHPARFYAELMGRRLILKRLIQSSMLRAQAEESSGVDDQKKIDIARALTEALHLVQDAFLFAQEMEKGGKISAWTSVWQGAGLEDDNEEAAPESEAPRRLSALEEDLQQAGGQASDADEEEAKLREVGDRASLPSYADSGYLDELKQDRDSQLKERNVASLLASMKPNRSAASEETADTGYFDKLMAQKDEETALIAPSALGTLGPLPEEYLARQDEEEKDHLGVDFADSDYLKHLRDSKAPTSDQELTKAKAKAASMLEEEALRDTDVADMDYLKKLSSPSQEGEAQESVPEPGVSNVPDTLEELPNSNEEEWDWSALEDEPQKTANSKTQP